MSKGDTPERKERWRNLRDRDREAYKADRELRKHQRNMESLGTAVIRSAAVAQEKVVEERIGRLKTEW